MSNIPQAVEVYSHDRQQPRLAGVLRPSFMGRSLAGASFEYDAAFIADGYALAPDLPLRTGRTFTVESTTLFGVFKDAAPDEWGQRIVQAAHTRSARKSGVAASPLGEFDFLLGVSDRTRMGALRLREPGDETWLSAEDRIAGMHELPRILEAAHRYEKHEATDEDIAYLNGIATSPGGARPKANVIDERGILSLAKLPHSKDGELDVERWEAVALTLARDAGISVAPFAASAAHGRKAVLVVERFDRRPDGSRIPYMSAFTAMGLGTHKTGNNLTYVDLADTLASVAGSPREDLHRLFDRIALNVLISNADDHWRNHGFLREGGKWQLSPAFDLNPSRATSISSRRISDDADPDRRTISDLLQAADAFELTADEASASAARVAGAVRTWPETARRLGVPDAEIAAMAEAFPDDQIQYALSPRGNGATSIPLSSNVDPNPEGMMWVKPHRRHGKTVEGYWRERPHVPLEHKDRHDHPETNQPPPGKSQVGG